jgi:hypothetical protein
MVTDGMLAIELHIYKPVSMTCNTYIGTSIIFIATYQIC